MADDKGHSDAENGSCGADQGPAAVYDTATSPPTLRGRDQITGFFAGFQIAEPGIVPMPS
jgi:hypothetical protein